MEGAGELGCLVGLVTGRCLRDTVTHLNIVHWNDMKMWFIQLCQNQQLNALNSISGKLSLLWKERAEMVDVYHWGD